jgi:hypothetical protein
MELSQAADAVVTQKDEAMGGGDGANSRRTMRDSRVADQSWSWLNADTIATDIAATANAYTRAGVWDERLFR